MKRNLLTAIALLWGVCVMAQRPMAEVSLADMTFVRQSFVRNFYTSHKEMSQINMEGTDLFLPNSANLIVESKNGEPTLTQHGRTLEISSEQGSESVIRVGAFHPYLCYEAEIGDLDANDTAGIAFYPNNGEGRAVCIIYQDGRIAAVTDGVAMAEKEIGQQKRISLRVQYTGVRFHVFNIQENGQADLLFSVENDMRAIESCTTYSFGVYTALTAGNKVTLHKAQSLLTSGTGQADPQVIQTTDGRPLIRDGRLYICFTTRGFERIFDSYQGVYSLDLDSYELRLEGALFFGKGDGIMYGFHATKVVYDPATEEYLVMTTTHEDTHTLAWARTKADLLHGMHY
ncbi:MAG: hypothetical protein IJ976_04980, partial [Alistipes sp.]|nr:hypothetical protein [Alistipes sp.]